jgi:predicted dehydrogenase
MRVLQIGAGSMGRRRMRDMRTLGAEVLLYEPQPDRCREIAEKFSIPGYTDLEQALNQQPEAIVVSTPPALHAGYVEEALKRKLHVFAEVPFVYDVDVAQKIYDVAPSYPSVLGVSHTLRFYPPIRLIHDLLQEGRIGKPIYIEHSLGNYLGDWHPYEDYRKFYASDVKLGGAGMDMILWELYSIHWWMGEIKSVQARFSKVSPLEIQGPDVHDVLLTFRSGAQGFLHHDIIEMGTQGRHVRVIGDAGTIEWHQNNPEVRVYDGVKKTVEMVPFSKVAGWTDSLKASSKMAEVLAATTVQTGRSSAATTATGPYIRESDYLREMTHFLSAAQGKVPYTLKTMAEELHDLRTFFAILESAESGNKVTVPE